MAPPLQKDAFRGDDVEQRIYGTILQTREPTTASAIADVADCDPKTARKYLGWFSEPVSSRATTVIRPPTSATTPTLSGGESTSSRPTTLSKTSSSAFGN